MQTIWSTDIVQWSVEGGKSTMIYQWPALKVFLAVSLPMTVVTIIICWLGYRLWAYRTIRKILATQASDEEKATR